MKAKKSVSKPKRSGAKKPGKKVKEKEPFKIAGIIATPISTEPEEIEMDDAYGDNNEDVDDEEHDEGYF